MLKAKEVDGMSERYVDDLQNRLGRFAEKFGACGIADLTTAEMQSWLNELGLAHRGRNNFRATIVALSNFAKSRGYLPKSHPTEADELSKAKGADSPIGIFTPAELSMLLAHADNSLVPYLAIGAFAGLRTAEIQRLSWAEVKLEQGHIEVAAHKAKTAQRRLVPISANLSQWIQPHADNFGLVCKLSTINQKASDFAKRLEIEWPHNGLRHSYASYRLAHCKNAGEVALEMGNSPQMIFRHYRELVTSADSAKWWSISPRCEEKAFR
jgi:integrase